MKRKIFTLLLAIGVLTAFQANAQQRQKIRIKAETSGLANTKPGVRDSFPFEKTVLNEWLSVSEEGNLVVKKDRSAIFELGFSPSGDSTSFRFFIPEADAPLKLKYGEEEMSQFEIITLRDEEVQKAQKNSGYFGDLVNGRDTTIRNDHSKGYLVSVTAGSSMKLDTIDFLLVGADRDGKLSLKKFKDFAFYGDSVPYAPYTAYQYDKKFESGKLYQSKSFPYFQTYQKDSIKGLINIRNDGNDPNNWGNINVNNPNPNPNDSLVYSWLDIKLSGNSAVELLGKTIRLDSIKFFADTLTRLHFSPTTIFDSINASSSTRKWHGLDTTSLHRDNIRPFIRKSVTGQAAAVGDSAYHVYLKDENGSLSFTVKTDSTSNDNDWTNGYPTKFKFKNDSLYYRIDTMMLSILPDIIKKFAIKENEDADSVLTSLFYPTENHISRYLYKNDDSWRPLYVKLDSVDTEAEAAKIPAEYAGWKWVKENRYNLSAAVQRIAGNNDGIFISNEDGGASFTSDTEKEAKFQFEKADTIGKDGKFKSYHAKKDSSVSVTGEPEFDSKSNANANDVELFRIKNGNDGKYLTVLKTTEFADAGPLTVTNTQVGWHEAFDKSGVDSIERARQWFAIAYNYVDENIALLPVASYRGHLEGTTVTHDDTLTFNLSLGNITSEKDVDFTNVWYLASNSKPGGDHKLVVAKEGLTRVWFKLDRGNLSEWTDGLDNTYVSIKKGNNYYRVDSSFVSDISDNDIKAHWKINRVDTTVDNKQVKNAWKFTPVINGIYGDPLNKHFARKTVFAFKEGDEILLVDDANEKVLDTVRVENNIDPKNFSLFAELNKAKVTIVSGDKYIALGTPASADNDSIYVASYTDTGNENQVTVTKSDVRYLVNDSLYPIRHYIFSIKKDGKEYFLNAGERNVRWVLLDSAKGADASFKFALPEFEEGVYLQTLDTGKTAGPRVIRLVTSANRLEVADVESLAEAKPHEGIYSAIDFYNKGKDDILVWKFTNVSIKPEEWLSDADLNFGEGDRVNGVLGSALGSIGYTADDKGVKYGFLQATDIPLTLKRPATVRSTAAGSEKEVETYNIMSGEFYLSDEKRPDNRATFTEAPQEFAFWKAGEDQFAIVSAASIDGGELRYLSAKGTKLIFTDEEDEKLDFTWEEREVTAIKAITASGKIYGVAGGVKVSGATGAVAIYTVDGRLVTKKAVTSPNQTIAVPAGIYVVRNGAEVTKVVVK